MADREPGGHGRYDWPLILAGAAIAFLILLSLIWQVADFVASGRLDDLRPWQTAISAAVGFAGLIITTGLGFYFAVRGRREDARITRDRDRDNREQETRALAAALAVEMDRAAKAFGYLKSIADEQQPADPAVGGFSVLSRLPIYEANLDRIGLLGPRLAGHVAQTAQDLAFNAWLIRYLQDFSSETDGGFLPDVGSSGLEKEIKRANETMRALLYRAKGVVADEDLPHSAAPE